MPDAAEIKRFVRHGTIKVREPSQQGAPKGITLIASTDAPITCGDWREILVHSPEAIDASTCKALLQSHDTRAIIGAIKSIRISGGRCEMDAEILPGAKMESDVEVQAAIDAGALTGVSIGYGYKSADCVWDEEARTLTVNKWRLLEASLTPTQADPACSLIRELPSDFTKREPAKETPMTEPTAPVVAPAPDVAAIRAAAQAEMREIIESARSLGVEVTDKLLSLAPDAARKEMVRSVGEKRSTPEPTAPVVSMQVDAEDKLRSAAVDAMSHRIIGVGEVQGNPLAGKRTLGMFRAAARRLGIRGAEDMENKPLANAIVGVRDANAAANISLASYASFVFANAITKIVAKGQEMGAQSTRYQRIVDTQTVADFKQYTIGGLGVTNLQKTAENVAFPSLSNAEGYYNSTAKMWGGTLSLSVQALVSDDTAEFDRNLRQAGAIAEKTIDRRVFQKLLMGTSSAEGTSTWTSNTTSGTSPVWTTADTIAAARSKFQLGIVAMQNKIGLDGNPLGNTPRFLVCGPTAGIYLRGIVGQANGQLIANPIYEVVDTPWLEASALTGYSTSSWYILCDPMTVTGLILSKIAGYESIQVEEFDSGAVAARNWKLWQPFEADLYNCTNAAATVIIPGAQQCTT